MMDRGFPASSSHAHLSGSAAYPAAVCTSDGRLLFDAIRLRALLAFAPATRVAYRIGDKLAVALEHYADFGPHPPQSLFAVFDYAAATGSSSASAADSLTPPTRAC